MRLELEIIAGIGTHQRLQLFKHRIGFFDTAPVDHVLVEHDLRAHHAVHGFLVDTDLAQAVGQLVLVGVAIEIGRRTLQHRYVGARVA